MTEAEITGGTLVLHVQAWASWPLKSHLEFPLAHVEAAPKRILRHRAAVVSGPQYMSHSHARRHHGGYLL